MSTRKSRHKHVASRSQNGDAEVFVLPPNLLQKLGIDLGNVAGHDSVSYANLSGTAETTIEQSESKKRKKTLRNKGIEENEKFGFQENSFKSPPNRIEENHSSNLKTAKLLKDSVFLSPTVNIELISNEEVTISNGDQLEILNNQSNPDASITDIINQVTAVEVICYTKDFKNIEKQQSGLNLLPDIVPFNQSMHSEIINNFVNCSEMSVITNTKLNEDPHNATDDHLDEAYSSDCSNSNQGLTEIVEQFVNMAEKLTLSSSDSPSKKINIISEEILSPGQLNELKRLHSPALSLMPVDINTIIQGHHYLKNLTQQKCFTTQLSNNNSEQSEAIVMYDEKGNMFETDINFEPDFSLPVIIRDKINTDKTLPSEKKTSIITDIDNSLKTVIEISVDIERHLEEDEEILEKFANEITSNTTHDILDKIEQNEILDKCIEEAPIISVKHTESLADLSNNNLYDDTTGIQVKPIYKTNDVIENIVEEVNTIGKSDSSKKNSALKEKMNATKSSADNQEAKEAIKLSNAEIVLKKSIANDSIIDSLCAGEQESKLNKTKHWNTSIDQVAKTKDNVSQIAKYLSDYLNKKKVRKSSKEIQIQKEKCIRGANSNLQSKLCIHGVEKPGGMDENRQRKKHMPPNFKQNVQYGKTYERKIREKPNTIIVSNQTSELSNQELTKVADGHNLNLNINISHDDNNEDFCVCADFGQLAYYESDSIYEHIHFWEHKKSTYNYNILFSIFNEDILTPESGKDYSEVNDSANDLSEPFEHGICWNNIYEIQSGLNANIVQINSEESMKHIREVVVVDEIVAKNIDAINSVNITSAKHDDSGTHKEVLPCKTSLLQTEVIAKISTDTNTDKLEEINAIVECKAQENNVLGTMVVDCIDLDENESTQHGNENSSTDIKGEVRTPGEGDSVIQNSEGDFQCEPENILEGLIKSGGEKKRRRSKRNVEEPENKKSIKCGVCKQLLAEQEWQDHITKHAYMAWKQGEIALDMKDEEAVRKHLKRLSTQFHGLMCLQCKTHFNNPKVYLKHTRTCSKDDKSMNDLTLPENIFTEKNEKKDISIKKKIAKCGVCDEKFKKDQWIEHIAKHDYLAWKHGEKALDLGDEAAMSKHLGAIIKQIGGLVCSKCGLARKTGKTFLKHINNCTGSVELESDTDKETDKNMAKSLFKTSKSKVKCGVCAELVKANCWLSHIEKHNYLACHDGDSLDINDTLAVQDYLSAILKEIDALTCWKCGSVYKSVKPYQRHTKVCRVDKPVETSLQSTNKSVRKSLEATEKRVKKSLEASDKIVKKSLEASDKRVKKSSETFDKCVEKSLKATDKRDKRSPEAFDKPVEESSEAIDKSIEKSSWSSEDVKPPLDLLIKIPAQSLVKCGICHMDVQDHLWDDHTAKEHDYLAWKQGDEALDLDDNKSLYQYLTNLAKRIGELKCSKCGLKRKYGKPFLDHVRRCDASSLIEEKLDIPIKDTVLSINDPKIKCGACEKVVMNKDWHNHVETHEYLAWQDGHSLDINDPDAVYNHLYAILKSLGALTCWKCTTPSRHVKLYQRHMRACNVTAISIEAREKVKKQKIYTCAMCSKQVASKAWEKHKMNKHYNIAWIEGDVPIDINNPYAVEKYLKEYRDYNNVMSCKTCGLTRASYNGFYAHVITCGKTEQELEKYRGICEICEKPYLLVYYNQHMGIHREQEYTKLKKAANEEKQKEINSMDVDVTPPGRRRAAQKANKIVMNYKKELDKYTYVCENCDFGTNEKKEMSLHKCQGNADLFTGGEEGEADDDDVHDVDSDVSLQEESKEKSKRKSKAYIANAPTLPIAVSKPKEFIKRAINEFFSLNLTEDVLFPQWRSCKYTAVSENQLSTYMPPLEESCQVMFAENTWETYKRFQANKGSGFSLFTGGAIQCISWVPPGHPIDDLDEDSYLTVVCHNDTDLPRYLRDEIILVPGLIQIWNFSQFSQIPELMLGVAHDLGTIWAMEWCPSGVRDPVQSDDGHSRLGLLAVATSNGSAYIFSVPYPSAITKNDNIFYKLEPVAELRLYSSNRRKKYQATSLSWSQKKGHAIIIVGYADGVIAYYDLNSESPLLVAEEEGMKIYYPYHEDNAHRSSITDVCMYPSSAAGVAAGLVGSCATSGSALGGGARGRGAGAGAARGLAAAAAVFTPHWPAAVLAGDDVIINAAANEFELTSTGRRLGNLRSAAACTGCARLALLAKPVLRVMLQHPVYSEPIKKNIAIIELAPLGKKRKLRKDELTVLVNPMTYKETVAKYGIRFSLDVNNKSDRQRLDITPDRFPLEDVTSLALCPTPCHHGRLAVATHAGIIFVVGV